MRATMVVVTLLLSGVGALPALAAPGSPQADPFARHRTFVADHVWLIYNSLTSSEPPFEGNVVVFEQSDRLVVVDAGGCPRSGDNVVAQIRSISHKPVRFLIYTHYHGDHNLGAGAFRKAWPAVTIVSTTHTRDSMTGAPMRYIATYDRSNAQMVEHAHERLQEANLSPGLRRGWQHVADIGDAFVAGYKNLRAYPADVTFDDTLMIPDSVTPLEVRFLGLANTDGDAVVWAPQQRVLASGDVVVNPIPYAASSFPAEWIKVLAALRRLEYTALVPGHGPVLHDTQYIDKLSAALGEVERQVTTLVASGKPLDQVRQAVNLETLRDTFAGGDDWDRARFSDFFLDPIVANAYKEAKDEPIVQGSDSG
jgi:glyoxylase-like metal-dependent hydrolase (beta-lactamase superfamily II)